MDGRGQCGHTNAVETCSSAVPGQLAAGAGCRSCVGAVRSREGEERSCSNAASSLPDRVLLRRGCLGPSAFRRQFGVCTHMGERLCFYQMHTFSVSPRCSRASSRQEEAGAQEGQAISGRCVFSAVLWATPWHVRSRHGPP